MLKGPLSHFLVWGFRSRAENSCLLSHWFNPTFPLRGQDSRAAAVIKVPATEDQAQVPALAQTKTLGSSGLGQAIGWPGCPLGVKHSL